MIQLSYLLDPPVATPGMMGNDGPSSVVSRGAQVNIGFGAALVQGTADGQCNLPASSGDIANLLGVSVYDASLPPAGWPPGWPGAYGLGSTVRILRKGQIWVQVEESVTPSSPVYVRFASDGGSFTVPGTFRASPDVTGGLPTAGFIASGARYLTSASASGFALLDLNLPG